MNDNVVLIGLGHKARSGKDYAANLISQMRPNAIGTCPERVKTFLVGANRKIKVLNKFSQQEVIHLANSPPTPRLLSRRA